MGQEAVATGSGTTVAVETMVAAAMAASAAGAAVDRAAAVKGAAEAVGDCGGCPPAWPGWAGGGGCGLWHGLECEIKGFGPIMSNSFGQFFSIFHGQKK